MAARLMLVAHAATAATKRAAFPLDEAIEGMENIGPVQLRAGMWLSGPELRCRQTAGALGRMPAVVDGFADLDAGRWAGAVLPELMAAEPESVMAWMTDVTAAPHGGESLQELISRVGDALDGSALAGRPWPDGLSVIVAGPLVIRAAIVHLLGAPSSLLFGVDIEPLSATHVTGHAGRWKLRALLPWGRWGQIDF
jgi:broad specificity phosphatase PhoE